jgi:ribonuclease HI
MVNELINPLTGQWDEQLVRDNFMEIDADAILATPIRDDFEDFFAWHYDSRGLFSVKSAYKLYVQGRDGSQQSSSNQGVETLEWEKIWKLACPPKIKQFMWRFAHNSLPLRMNIKRRGMKCDTKCVCCMRLDEDGAHLFLKCKEVKYVWRELKLEDERLILCTCPDAKAVVHHILSLKEEVSSLIACLLWHWWNRRNKINSKEFAGDKINLVSKVHSWAGESKLYCSRVQKAAPTENATSVWRPPRENVLKINIDGAYRPETKEGGWGFVVRDNHGQVRGSGAGKLSCIASAAQAEARACEEAAHAASEWGVTHVLIESDSQNLVRAMQSTEFDRAPEGIIYRDLRLYMQLSFNSFEFTFAPRTCNKIAHELAAYGASRQDILTLWPESLPNDVLVSVASVFAVPST